jgi:hypothetical protein
MATIDQRENSDLSLESLPESCQFVVHDRFVKRQQDFVVSISLVEISIFLLATMSGVNENKEIVFGKRLLRPADARQHGIVCGLVLLQGLDFETTSSQELAHIAAVIVNTCQPARSPARAT